MRITFSMQTNETLQNVNDQQEQINTLSQQISSGKLMSSPSDSPLAWSESMNANQTLREYNSFLSNINFATGWGQTTESALSQLSDLLTQAKGVAEEATSAAGESESSALASEVNGILKQAMTIANTQYDGQYVFAGTSTDSQPYSIDNSTGVVTYSGNTSSLQVKTSTSGVSAGGMSTVNLTGEDVFGTPGGSNDVLNQIWSLGQALSNGNSTAVSNSITTLSNAFNQVNDQLTTIGANVSALSNQQSALNTLVTNETGFLSGIQDTDVASATVKLSQAQTSFQAALKVTSILDSLNLSSILSGSSS